MAIKVVCPQGHRLVAEDRFAGKKVRCPHCQAIVVIPAGTTSRAADSTSAIRASPSPSSSPPPPAATTGTAPPAGQKKPAGSPPAKPPPKPPEEEVLIAQVEEIPEPVEQTQQAAPEEVIEATLEVSEEELADLQLRPPAPSAPLPARRPLPDDEPESRPRRRRPPPVEEDDEDEDIPRPRRRRSSAVREQMRRTCLGLRLYALGLLLSLIAMGLGLLTMILGPLVIGSVFASGGISAGTWGLAFLVMIVNWIVYGCYIAGVILSLVGTIFCLFVPERTGGKVFVILSVVLFWFMPLGNLFFLLFLRRLAHYLREWGMGEEAMSILMMSLVIGVSTPVVFVLLFLLFQLLYSALGVEVSMVLSIILGMVFFITLIVMCIKLVLRQLALVDSLRKSLAAAYNLKDA
jgi:hypothetical protein